MSAAPQYAPGHSEHELKRLDRQGQLLAPFTRKLFQAAGIVPGMRVMDVGCGSGAVSLLLAELVGTHGAVVAVDREAKACECARANVESAGHRNVRFVHGDPATTEFERPFDAAVGRLVLMYYPDPVEALRGIASKVRSGGVIAFHEFDVKNCHSEPPAPLYEQCIHWIKAALQHTVARQCMGLELWGTFQNAGLPTPEVSADTVLDFAGTGPWSQAVADVVRSIAPVLKAQGLADLSEIELNELGHSMASEASELRSVLVGPMFVGAHARKN